MQGLPLLKVPVFGLLLDDLGIAVILRGVYNALIIFRACDYHLVLVALLLMERFRLQVEVVAVRAEQDSADYILQVFAQLILIVRLALPPRRTLRVITRAVFLLLDRLDVLRNNAAVFLTLLDELAAVLRFDHLAIVVERAYLLAG